MFDNLVSTIKSKDIPFDLPLNWKWYNWGDLIVKYEQGLIRSNSQLGDSGIAYLKMNNLDNDGGYSLSKLEYTEASQDEIERYRLRRGDFLINVRNSKELVGKTCAIGNLEFDVIYNHMLVRIEHQSGISGFYINALLKTPVMRKFIDRCKKGTTTVIALYQADLYKIPIPLPDKKTHDAIVNYIENYSDKIELNNKINAELEAMAKTIYDYWFVQFDFPNAKNKPYKSSGGKMVWNEELKREIPEGWDVTSMQDWIDTNKSGDWGKEELEGNYTTKVTCIRGADINGLNGLGELKPPTRFILDKNSFKILEPNDIVVEISGGSPTQSTGRMAYITEATIKRFENPLICSNFCKPVTIKNKKLLYNFAYYWNSLYDAGIFFGYEGKTSGIKNFLFDSFVSSYYTVVPEESVVNKFYDIVENIHAKKQTALAENQQLASLRDWLLPMLMNGQVKVKDAKKVVEESLTHSPKKKNEKTETKKCLPIDDSKISFAKQVLAGKIIGLFREDKNFTDIKFQKLQYLAEHIAQVDLNWNYYRKAAGPYDNKFMHTVYRNQKNNKWFADRRNGFRPLSRSSEIDKYFHAYFGPVESDLINLFNALKSATEFHCEAIATVYAVWNDLIIKDEPVSDNKLIDLFLKWSTRKETYSKKQILSTIKWIKDKGISPTGFGRLIKEIKN